MTLDSVRSQFVVPFDPIDAYAIGLKDDYEVYEIIPSKILLREGGSFAAQKKDSYKSHDGKEVSNGAFICYAMREEAEKIFDLRAKTHESFTPERDLVLLKVGVYGEITEGTIAGDRVLVSEFIYLLGVMDNSKDVIKRSKETFPPF